MAYTNFKPAIWSELIDRALEKNLVFGKLANRKYEGDISSHGSTVTIPRIGSATIGDYTGADITFGTDAGAKQIISIDKSKYFALTFDDVDIAQSLGALKGTIVEEAIYKMADVVDQEMAKLEAKVVATNRVAVATGTSILAGLRGANRALNKTNVPKMGRWIVISPEVEESLLAELTNVVLPQTADFAATNGYIGKLYGFEIFSSNNVPVASNVHKCLCGTSASMTLAMQLSEIKAGDHEKSFGEFVKGLNLFGCDVAETEEGYTDRLATMDVSFT